MYASPVARRSTGCLRRRCPNSKSLQCFCHPLWRVETTTVRRVPAPRSRNLLRSLFAQTSFGAGFEMTRHSRSEPTMPTTRAIGCRRLGARGLYWVVGGCRGEVLPFNCSLFPATARSRATGSPPRVVHLPVRYDEKRWDGRCMSSSLIMAARNAGFRSGRPRAPIEMAASEERDAAYWWHGLPPSRGLVRLIQALPGDANGRHGNERPSPAL